MKIILLSTFAKSNLHLCTLYISLNNYSSNTYRCTINNLVTLANANKNGSTYIESHPIIHTPSHPHRHIHLNTLLNSQHILTHPTIQFHSFTTNQYLLYVEEQSSASSQKCTRYTHVYFEHAFSSNSLFRSIVASYNSSRYTLCQM